MLDPQELKRKKKLVYVLDNSLGQLDETITEM